MPYLDNHVYDNGLSRLDLEATTFHICSSEPATFGGVAGVTLGNKALASGDINAPSAGSPNGRKVDVAALSGGNVTGSGTATHFAITDATSSRLLAAGALSASQAVTAGNTFSTAAFTIRIPAAV
jgi:hypothetical protein